LKHLYLLRHGKSDWGADHEGDHERPLAKRGRRAAEVVGRFLADLEQVPDEVLSSSAVRARTTAELSATAGGWKTPIRVLPELYEATPDTLLAEIRRQGEKHSRLLLVGHEPVWSETAGLLVGRAQIKMVTATLARIDFGVDRWSEVDFGRGLLCWLVTPKLLDRGRT
jgi:phosphohistidine phosphatase